MQMQMCIKARQWDKIMSTSKSV